MEVHLGCYDPQINHRESEISRNNVSMVSVDSFHSIDIQPKNNLISISWMLSIKTIVALILNDEILSAIIIMGLLVYSLQLHSIACDCKVTWVGNPRVKATEYTYKEIYRRLKEWIISGINDKAMPAKIIKELTARRSQINKY